MSVPAAARLAAKAAVAGQEPPGGWPATADPARAEPAPRPSALVVGAFPPAEGDGAVTAAVLAMLGFSVVTASVAPQGGDAHFCADFARIVDLREWRAELAGRRFDLVVIDPGVFAFRRPRRALHLFRTALQLRVILDLLRCGRRVVLMQGRPTGFAPSSLMARLVLATRRSAALDGTAALGDRRAAIARAAGLGAEAGAAPLERHALVAELAAIGPADRPRAAAAAIARAALRARTAPAALALTGTGQEGGNAPARRAPLAIAGAPDAEWSAGEVAVPRLAVHMRDCHGALGDLRPGTAGAARRLLDWCAGPLREIGGPLSMPPFLAGRGGEDPEAPDEETHFRRRIASWWADLATHDGLRSPLESAAPPDGETVDRLARILASLSADLAGAAGAADPERRGEVLLADRVAPGENALSGLEFGLGLVTDIVGRAPETGAGWRAVEARRLLGGVLGRNPALRRLTTPGGAGGGAELALIGFARNQTGLSENLSMTAAALRRAGFTPVTRAIELGLARIGEDAGGPPRLVPAAPVRLLHVNADLAPQALVQPALAGDLRAVNIGFLLWEFGVLPRAHRLALDMLDEAWCPTDFVADAYRATGRLPVHRIGKAVTLGPVEEIARETLGIARDVVVFLVTFDFHSSVERKNPVAAVRAFQRAFPSDRGVALVLKTTEVVRGHWGDPNGQWQAIRKLARHDPRITIMTGLMPRPRYLGLMAAADCLVSPHRAEGFGYSPAQAMLLGRPVIVTDWSGTRDFCTEETSFPVPAELVPVRPDETILPMEGAIWAGIDEAALAEAMRRVAEDRAEAGRRAAAGRALMLREYSVDAQAARYLDRLRALGLVLEEA